MNHEIYDRTTATGPASKDDGPMSFHSIMVTNSKLCSIYTPPFESENELIGAAPDLAKALVKLGEGDSTDCAASSEVGQALRDATKMGEDTLTHLTEAIGEELAATDPSLKVQSDYEVSNEILVKVPERGFRGLKELCEAPVLAAAGQVAHSSLQLSFDGEDIYETTAKAVLQPFEDWTPTSDMSLGLCERIMDKK